MPDVRVIGALQRALAGSARNVAVTSTTGRANSGALPIATDTERGASLALLN